MELHFKDLLISIKFSDYSFQNPVELRLGEDGPPVGFAYLCEKKDRLLGDLVINQHVDYLETYPRVAINATAKQIGHVFLSEQLPIDPEVKKLKEQISAQPSK